jgi:hypothetical protein
LQAKISDALDGQQKRNRITNLLQEMRREKIAVVSAVGHCRGSASTWEWYKPPEKDDRSTRFIPFGGACK